MREKVSAEVRSREIRRKTRKNYSSEEKVRIVLEGLRGEESIATLPVEQGVSRNRKETSGRRHEAGSYNVTRWVVC